MSGITFEEARDALSQHVGADALAHCDRVASTAVDLAKAYGVDVDDARMAGLLHDWSRDDSNDALLSSAERAGLQVTDVDRNRPYLLHAHTASRELAAVMPDVPQRILKAIESHTMGAIGMSDLDRIVYIADMIEPSRTQAALEPLRDGVGNVPLGALFLEAYAVSLARVVEQRKPVHPRSVEVWNDLVAKECS